MAMRVTRDNSLALSVSADHLVGRYDLVRVFNPYSSFIKDGSGSSRQRWPLKMTNPDLLPIEQSIPVTALLLSGMMEESVLSVAGMESESFSGHHPLCSDSYSPVIQNQIIIHQTDETPGNTTISQAELQCSRICEINHNN